MAKPKIFISYDYDNDKHYKNMLLAWDKNDEFDFAFSDHSADVSIQSMNTEAIKRVISAKINSATHFLCIVGAKTSKSGWVAWEIDKAKELKKKFVAVKTAPDNTTPSGLLNAGASWAMSFTFDAIKKAISGA
ncbi:MAG: TIR-like domain-containing protein [Betaproteobacteria bacterium]|nr:TIR-like domain-containing protein [Betaproteobacteria bacterium]